MHDVLGQLAVGEHYQPNMQDTVTLLCRFMDIPTKVGASHHHPCSSTSACISLQQQLGRQQQQQQSVSHQSKLPQQLSCMSSSAWHFHQQLVRHLSTSLQHLCLSSSAWSLQQLLVTDKLSLPQHHCRPAWTHISTYCTCSTCGPGWRSTWAWMDAPVS